MLAVLGPFFSQLGEWIAPVIEWFKNLFVPVEMTAQELSGFTAAGKADGKAIGGKFLLAAAVPELNACQTYSPSRLAAKIEI